MVGINWEMAIDKDVKSIDNIEIGKIKNIINDAVQIQKGTVNTKNFYVPKYYIQGYDGKYIWLSLTENETANYETKTDENVQIPFDSEEELKKRHETEKKYPNLYKEIPPYLSKEDLTTETPQISWKELIGKEVKTAEDDTIGKLNSIGPSYVEIIEGTVNKHRYFVPKEYFGVYDGKRVYTKLLKDEIKKYEMGAPPLEGELDQKSEFQNQSIIPPMAKEPDLKIETDMGNKIINWEDAIHKHIRTADNIDIGYVEQVGNGFIIAREGVVNIHKYYIPQRHVSKYDGSSLWIDLPSISVFNKFERKNDPTPEELENILQE